MFKIGIIGDTGMVGQELDKILKFHTKVDIIYRRNSKREVGDMKDCDCIFLATKDLESMKSAKECLGFGIKVIDMSGAFRLPKDKFEKWYGMEHIAPELLDRAVYGMPAINFDKIKNSDLIANPGCYPTSVILALYPLRKFLKNNIYVVSTSGNSGARREIEDISNDVTYSYGKKHKHTPEMEEYSKFDISFTPIVLRSVFKGINTNIIAEVNDEFSGLSDTEIVEVLENAIKSSYLKEDRVFVVKDSSDKTYGTADVNETHDLLIKVRADSGKIYINSLIDNLMKGAASQGVENMNIIFGLNRLEGLESFCKRIN